MSSFGVSYQIWNNLDIKLSDIERADRDRDLGSEGGGWERGRG